MSSKTGRLPSIPEKSDLEPDVLLNWELPCRQANFLANVEQLAQVIGEGIGLHVVSYERHGDGPSVLVVRLWVAGGHDHHDQSLKADEVDVVDVDNRILIFSLPLRASKIESHSVILLCCHQQRGSDRLSCAVLRLLVIISWTFSPFLLYHEATSLFLSPG